MECLVVEDSDFDREVLKITLEDLGFHVLEASSGDEAIRVCNTNTPKIIFLDWNMPGTDGKWFLEKLSYESKVYSPKIVLCTGDEDISMVEAMYLGVNGFLGKPVSSDKISKLVLSFGDMD